MPPKSPVRDKNVECKQRKTYANRGENHTEVITSTSKRKKLMEFCYLNKYFYLRDLKSEIIRPIIMKKL